MLDSIRTPGFLEYLIGTYVYYLPIVLYILWAPIAVFDISRRQDIGNGTLIFWIFAIFMLPVFGGGAYLLFGNSEIKKPIRLTMVLGGIGVFVVLIFMANLMGV